MFFGTRAYEEGHGITLGKKNNIDVTTSTELLSVDTVDQLKIMTVLQQCSSVN